MSMENWKRLRNTFGERLPQCRYKTVPMAFPQLQ